MQLTTQQIITNVEKSQDLIDRIKEYKSYIEQLKNPMYCEADKKSIRQYNECIINLEAELKQIWNNK